MSAALQVYYTAFDSEFFKLSAAIRARIESKIDDMGQRLGHFPHHRLAGSMRFRLRVGEHRIIYTYDTGEGVIHLLAVGHRREIYRRP